MTGSSGASWVQKYVRTQWTTPFGSNSHLSDIAIFAFLHLPIILISGSSDLAPGMPRRFGDLVFAIQNTAPLSSGRIVPRVTVAECNSIPPTCMRSVPNVKRYCW